MTWKLGLIAMLVFLGFAPCAHAQFFQGGIAFQANGRGFGMGGYAPYVPAGRFYGSSMFGTIQQRVVIQRIVMPQVPRPAVPDYDLSGIDLDVHTPDRLYPPGTAPQKKAERLAQPRKADEKPKAPEPPAKPEVAAPAVKPPVDDIWQPRVGAVAESERLVELGMRAFRAQEYGLAAMRFRQASEVNRANGKAFFLLGQAYMAVGQFRDAVRAIEAGLRIEPDWPAQDFKPRTELYTAADDWIEHRRRLSDAVKRQPKDPAFAFLRAYAAWFDGARPQATAWFVAARVLAPDPRWIDLFLKRAPGPAVAAR